MQDWAFDNVEHLNVRGLPPDHKHSAATECTMAWQGPKLGLLATCSATHLDQVYQDVILLVTDSFRAIPEGGLACVLLS